MFNLKNIFLTSLIIVVGTISCFFNIGFDFIENIEQVIEENFERTYNKYKVNEDNAKEISYKDKVYQITTEKVNIGKLDKPIGEVLKTYIVDKNCKAVEKKYLDLGFNDNIKRCVSYGLVYSVMGEDNDIIAVEINNSFRLARLK